MAETGVGNYSGSTKKKSSTATAYNPIGNPQDAAGTNTGANGWGGSSQWSGRGNLDKYVSPWAAALRKNYEEASAPSAYKEQWKKGVDQASALGSRDYETALRGYAQEDVDKQITSADNQLGAIGMRELALKGDVQSDRAKMRTDASTKAMIDSQAIKTDALNTMKGMLESASGAELDRINAMIEAAASGSGEYNSYMSNVAIPLQEREDEIKKDKLAALQGYDVKGNKKVYQDKRGTYTLSSNGSKVYQ